MQQFPVVRECNDQWTGAAIATLLRDAGIEAHLTGTDAATALGMGGAPTGRLIRVTVPVDSYEAAVQVLERHEALAANALHWICPRCEEENEPSFEVCWNCKASSEGAMRVGPEGQPIDPLADPVPTSETRQEDLNPYRPVLPESPQTPSPQTATEHSVYRQSVRRAVLASIAVFFLLPPLLSVLPIYLLLTLPAPQDDEPRYWYSILFAWLTVALGIAWGCILFLQPLLFR